MILKIHSNRYFILPDDPSAQLFKYLFTAIAIQQLFYLFIQYYSISNIH